MSSILDLIGSFIIGGLLMMMILRVNTNYSQQSIEDRLELMVQENLTELIEEIEYDFRKIGYGVTVGTPVIMTVDTSAIGFRADLDNDGTVDIVAYNLSLPAVPGTVNPRDRILTRSVNGQTIASSLGIVDFQITAYDISGIATTTTTAIKSIEYYLEVESPFPVDSVFANSIWTAHIYPLNL
jgi:hypothetical protein